MASGIGIIFHGIGAPERELEPGEAGYWIDVDRFERLLDAIAASPDRARIRISFDDGNRSDHAIALPRLAARGLTADFFVLSGRIGKQGSLDAGMIRELRDEGMGVGSHGIAHLNWAGLAPAALDEELRRSRGEIGEILGAPVREAGIPFGGYSARVLRAIRAAGYECAWSSDCGMMDPGAFLRPRASVRAAMSEAELGDLIAGRLSPMRRLRRALAMTKKRLV